MNVIKSLRLNHWIKNLLIFIPLIFSQNLFDSALFLRTLAGFCVFSLLSSGIYLFNDIMDINRDKIMPQQFQRPIAKGLTGMRIVKILCLILITGPLILLFALDLNFGGISFIYCLLMISYSIFFKNIIFLDIIVVSIGFVIRPIAGAILIDVAASNWLIFCTFSLALFISTLKRKSRFCILGLDRERFNSVYKKYNLEILNWMTQIFASMTVLSYTLYIVSLRQERRGMFFTVPIVIYTILRYFYKNLDTKTFILPEKIVFSDRPLFISMILWILVTIVSIYGVRL